MSLADKDRIKPRKLYFNEAALRRVPLNHPKIPYIEEDNRRREAGFAGEIRVDTILKNLPQKNYHILQGLRLANEAESHFQIDNVMISPTHLLTIEVKNLAGELTFDRQAGQLIQKIDNKQNGYEDPLLQAELQIHQLRDWLRKHQFPNMPLEHLVVMINQNCILKFDGYTAAQQFRVCRGRQVLHRIDTISNQHSQEVMNPAMIRKLSRLMVKNNTEPSYDIEKIYKISRSALLNRVFCPDCKFLGMSYHQGSWFCPRCKCKSRDAHLPALRDYFLLWGPEITNQQFREFLCIDSVHKASKMLKKLNLPSIGTKKHRVYQLSFNIF